VRTAAQALPAAPAVLPTSAAAAGGAMLPRGAAGPPGSSGGPGHSGSGAAGAAAEAAAPGSLPPERAQPQNKLPAPEAAVPPPAPSAAAANASTAPPPATRCALQRALQHVPAPASSGRSFNCKAEGCCLIGFVFMCTILFADICVLCACHLGPDIVPWSVMQVHHLRRGQGRRQITLTFHSVNGKERQ